MRGRKKLEPVDPDLVQATEIVPMAKASYRVTHGKVGAPTTLTPAVQEAMCNLLALGLSTPVAAQAMGIPRDTWRHWNQKGARAHARGESNHFVDWWLATNEAKASVEVTLVSRVVQASLHDWKAAQWLLERRFPERYQPADKRPDRDRDGDLSNKSTADLKQMIADAAAGKLLPASVPEKELEDDSDSSEYDDSDEEYEPSTVIDVESTAVDVEPDE